MHHTLKTWPEYFEKVRSGEKTFEIRKNDRNFQTGDILILQEWDRGTEKYTGREQPVTIGYMTNFQQQGGYAVMAVKRNRCLSCGSIGGNGTHHDERDPGQSCLICKDPE